MTEREFLTGDLPMHEYPTALPLIVELWPPEQILADANRALAMIGPAVPGPEGCSNCDDRKCMSCVFREVHGECRDDCPDCCNVDDLPAIIFPAEVRVTSETGGQKGTKLARFDLIPVQPLWAVAELYGYGTRKYADRNWERGYDWSLSYAALQRHANLFWSREDNDEETGLPHLAAVVFHALSLIHISEPTRRTPISYAVFCLKKK